MELSIIKGDILKMSADILVFPANRKPLIGGSLDSQIYALAGADNLLKDRSQYGYMHSGESCITNSYDLRSSYKWLIHTVTPVYQPTHKQDTMHKLKKCYLSALKLAEKNQAKSVVFALLGAGASGFSHTKAIEAAKSALEKYQNNNQNSSLNTVTIVEYENESKYNILLQCNNKLKEVYKLLSQIDNFEEVSQYGSYIGEIKSFVSKQLRQYAEEEISQIKQSYKCEIKRLSSYNSKIPAEDSLYKSIVRLPKGMAQSDFAATIYVSCNADISQIINLYSKSGKYYKNAISFLNVKNNVIKLGLGLELPFDKMCWLMWCRDHEFPISEMDFDISEGYIKKGKSLSALFDYEDIFENTKRKGKEIEF